MKAKITLQERLKDLRIEKGLSQEAFAEKCGLHRTYISDIECFQRNVSLESIQKIADAVEVDAYCLLMDLDQTTI